MNSGSPVAMPSNVETLPSAAAPVRTPREVPLKFWLGPFRVWTVKLNLQVETWQADPLRDAHVAEPSLQNLPAGAGGIYRPSEPLSEDTAILTATGAMIRYVESSFNRRFIDLATDFNAYMAKFSGKTRSTMKRKLRKFEKVSGGMIDWRTYRTAGEMRDFHAIAREISKRTYQEKLFDAGLPEDSEFIARMLSLGEAGNVRGYILFQAGQPISYLYLPIIDGRVIYGRLGFDPAHAAHSPGTVLQLLALEQLFAEQTYRIFDFTEGEGEHKRLFATHARHCGNVFYLRPTFVNRAIVRLHLAIRRLSTALDRQLAHAKVKTTLKRMLRGQ